MRRRLSSAAFPVHRHSLPQLAVDAGWSRSPTASPTACASTAASRTRYQHLLERTIAWVVVGSLVIFALFGLYQKWWRYVASATTCAIVQASSSRRCALAGLRRDRAPGEGRRSDRRLRVADDPDRRAGALLPADARVRRRSRFVVRAAATSARRAASAPRKDARSVLIVGAGDGGRLVLREILRNPDLGLRPVGFVDDDPRKRGMRVDGVPRARHDRRARRGSSTRSSPTRS